MKKALSISLIIAVLFSLCACSQQELADMATDENDDYVAIIGKRYAFRKIVRFLSADSGRFLLVGKFPKPTAFPLNTYNTTQSNFAEVLREFFQKFYLISYYGKVSKMPKYSLQGTTQGHGLTGADMPVRFSM